MSLNLAQVRRRISALLDGYDDRLVVLLHCEPRLQPQPELLGWLRSLLRRYEDDLEILVYACPVVTPEGGANANDGAQLVEFARHLQHHALPVAFPVGVTRLASPLEASAAWTVRWSFDAATLFALTGQLAGRHGLPRRPLASVAPAWGNGEAAGPGVDLRPGIIVPPGLLNAGVIDGSWPGAANGARNGSGGGRPEPMLVDVSPRPGRRDDGLQLARRVGDAIREGATHIVGAFAHLTRNGSESHAVGSPRVGVDGAEPPLNVDAIEALLDILANSVQQRRLAFATRPRGSLWSHL